MHLGELRTGVIEESEGHETIDFRPDFTGDGIVGNLDLVAGVAENPQFVGVIG